MNIIDPNDNIQQRWENTPGEIIWRKEEIGTKKHNNAKSWTEESIKLKYSQTDQGQGIYMA